MNSVMEHFTGHMHEHDNRIAFYLNGETTFYLTNMIPEQIVFVS